MARIKVTEVASELEYLRWVYRHQQSPLVDDTVELNNKFTESFGKNPPEQYEIKDENGNVITELEN